MAARTKSRGSIDKLPYLVRTSTRIREKTPKPSPSYKELVRSSVDLESIPSCRALESRISDIESKTPVLQRQFTFTGYDIMEDSEPKSPIEESQADKKLREHVHCYISSCKQLGITPSKYLTRHINDKHLVMKCRPLGTKGTRALCVSLVNNNIVESVDLEDNDIGSEGAICIAQMLRENDTITEISLAGNKILAKGTDAFAQLLKTGRNIHTLDISGSGLEDSDATVLANLIQTKSKLKVLNVSHNRICEFGALDLGRAIAMNDVIGQLDLSWNHIRGKGALAIALGMKKNVSLKKVNLAWNGFANIGTRALGKALVKNRTLKSLDISNNRIAIDGMKGFLRGLKENEALAELKMGHNPISPEVALTILRAIQDSNKCVLTALDLSEIVVRTDFLDKWDDIKCKRVLPLRIVFGPVMQVSTVASKEDELIDWRDPVMRMFKFMHDKGYRIIDLLKRLDKDRSLSVDRQELKNGLLAEKIPMTEAQLDEVVTRLDTDKDGEIDMGELIRGEKTFRRKMQARTRRLLTSTQRPDVALLKLIQIDNM